MQVIGSVDLANKRREIEERSLVTPEALGDIFDAIVQMSERLDMLETENAELKAEILAWKGGEK